MNHNRSQNEAREIGFFEPPIFKRTTSEQRENAQNEVREKARKKLGKVQTNKERTKRIDKTKQERSKNEARGEG